MSDPGISRPSCFGLSSSAVECESAWDIWHEIFNLIGRGDTKEWEPLWRRAMEQHPASIRLQGRLMLEIYGWYTEPADRQMRVFREIERHAESGIPWGMCKMGSAFFHGIGVPRDWSEASRWFEKAARADQAEAQCRLAGLIRSSGSTVRDMRRAADLYLRVAVKPYSGWRTEARASAAEMYAFGIGVPEDPHIARHLIEPMLRPSIRPDPKWPAIERVARRVGLLPA